MRKGNIGHRIERCRFGFKERVFSEMWQKENAPSFQNDLSFLQRLFLRVTQPWNPFSPWVRPRMIIKARDEFLVATVVQWLGTSVGWDFLERCVKACGFDLVPVDRRTKDYYYSFDPGYDASVWFNRHNQGQVQLPSFHRPFPKPRKHLYRRFRPLTDSFSMWEEICIRCGHEERGPYSSDPKCEGSYLETKEKLKDRQLWADYWRERWQTKSMS